MDRLRHLLGDHTQEQVANLLDVPLGTVKRRLHDARARLKTEMMEMVEEVLRDGGPTSDFSARVFELLDQRRHPVNLYDGDFTTEMKQISASGLDGFARALDQPHWQTRRAALFMLPEAQESDREQVIELVKRSLWDLNKKVRHYAAGILLEDIDVPLERKLQEFLPLVLPLLRDRSRKVRINMGWLMHDWAEHVPVEEVAQALLDEKDPFVRMIYERLLRHVLEVRASTQ